MLPKRTQHKAAPKSYRIYTSPNNFTDVQADFVTQAMQVSGILTPWKIECICGHIPTVIAPDFTEEILSKPAPPKEEHTAEDSVMPEDSL